MTRFFCYSLDFVFENCEKYCKKCYLCFHVLKA